MSDAISPDCHRLLEQIASYLDGELDVPTCDAIERHCAGCSRCAALIRGLQQTVGLCRDAGAAPLPDAVRARAQASIRRLLDRNDPV